MIVERMAVEELHVIFLALSTAERLKAAGKPFGSSSSTLVWLTVIAVVALIISDILLFWMYSKNRHSEHQFNRKITELTVANEKLQKNQDKSTAANEKLKQELAKLRTTNQKLKQESAQLT